MRHRRTYGAAAWPLRNAGLPTAVVNGITTDASDPNTAYVVSRRKPVPHAFVLDAILSLSPEIRPMFGCTAVYVRDKIVLILRDRTDETADNGVWLATTAQHHASLRREFPNMRSLKEFGKRVTDWQVLPADAPDFEEAALRACELIIARDPRIGKVPLSRSTGKSKPRNPKNLGARAKDRLTS